VQAFLKNVERKREKERAAASIPDTPVTSFTPLAHSTPTPVAPFSDLQAPDEQTPVQSIEHVADQDVVTEAEFEAKEDAFQSAAVDTSTTVIEAEGEGEAQLSQDVCAEILRLSNVVNNDIQHSADADGEDTGSRSRAQTEETDIEIYTGDEPQKNADGSINRDQYGGENEYMEMGQEQLYGANFGYNGDHNGYPGMNWTPEMAQQMQMMQQMPMPQGGWNGQNMMGDYFRTADTGPC
jgi:hypothetical protein